MPKADLPTSPRGWIVAMLASFIGLIVGFIATNWLARVFA